MLHEWFGKMLGQHKLKLEEKEEAEMRRWRERTAGEMQREM